MDAKAAFSQKVIVHNGQSGVEFRMGSVYSVATRWDGKPIEETRGY
jgi:hypothetical protein